MPHRIVTRRTASAICVLVAAALGPTGCGPGRGVAIRVVFPYVDAVRAKDLERMYCLYSGPVPGSEGGTAGAVSLAAFEAWARGRFAAFDAGSLRGQVDLGGDGIVLVKAFALGAGTNLGLTKVEARGRDRLEVETPATFNYEQIDTSALPPGSSFAVCRLPLGTVTTVRVPPKSGQLELDVLKSLTLRWMLERGKPRGDCPGEWGVVSVTVVPGSEKTIRAVWKF